MKTLAIIAAIGVTIVALRIRMRRSAAANHLLRSPLTRRAIRVAAIVLVFLGLGPEGAAQEEKSPISKPAPRIAAETPTAEVIDRWHALSRDRVFRRSCRLALELQVGRDAAELAPKALEELTRPLPPTFGALLVEELRGHPMAETAEPVAPEALAEAIAELDEAGFYFPAIDALLYRLYSRLDPAAAVITRGRLLASLANRRRISEAMLVAMARRVPIELEARAWASKAGPGRQIKAAEARARRELRDDLAEVLQDWGRRPPPEDAVTSGRATHSGLILHPPGETRKKLSNDEYFEFGRYSLLEATEDAVFLHAWLGPVRLPAGSATDAFTLATRLDAGQRETVDLALERALAGDRVAQGLLELSLPLCHGRIASSLAAHPTAPGADALRMILRLFDDLIVHEIPDFKVVRPKR